MVFFDLNIPYHESARKLSPTTKTSLKTTRLKLITKSLELGYTGAAYNHTVKGVMSDSDRCSIPLFPLSSILKLAPSLSSSVKFHRQLLNVPVSAPFRQYTRVTVVIDSPPQAAALNSGNPVLKTYDIVAVRPVNQDAFEKACQIAQVDIISIDFSEKLQFRLKQTLVKAAVKRGVYFEITYSGLISDAQARSQMISNAKLLVDWTRGKNLIISSGASSVTELRGAYDAANLSSLLGLTMERSKAAISKNCRSVIASALRKKHCYKEVIKVEKLPPGEEMNFDDWLKWDPISSAEGDLKLDDMGKYFSASCNALKAPKAIDFASALNGIPSHGLQIKDIISRKVAVSEPFAVSKDLTVPSDQMSGLVCEMPKQSLSFGSLHKKEQALAEGLVESSTDLEVSLSCDLSNFVSSERNDVDAVAINELESVQALGPKNAKPRCLQTLSCTASDERKGLLSNGAIITCYENTDNLSSHDQSAYARKSIPAVGFSSSSFLCDQSKLPNSVRLDIFTQSGTVGSSMEEPNRDNFEELPGIEPEGVSIRDTELPLASCDESLHDNCIERERSSEARDTSNEIEAKIVSRNDKELPPALCEESINNNCMERKTFLEEKDTSMVNIDGLPVKKSDDHIIIDNEHFICNEDPSKPLYDCSDDRIPDGEDETGTSDLTAAIVDEPHVTDFCSHIKTDSAQGETVEQDTFTSQMPTDGQAGTNNKLPDNLPLGRGGVKRKTSRPISLFPFKRFISPSPLRKKARK